VSLIHPTAVIDPSAKIDPGATIGPFAVIGPETTIGAGTVVGAHAVVEFAEIGRDNRIMPGAFVGLPPQDLKYKGEKTKLVMGDRNLVRECATLNRGTTATGLTKIGSDCLFMAYSHVGHDCVLGDGVILANSVALGGHVSVGSRTVIGGLVAVQQHTRIGSGCMLGGGSMLNKDVTPFCLCQGYPAVLRGLNLVGLRRSGLSREAISQVKEAYKTLFASGLRLEEALARLQSSPVGPEVASMIEFITASEIGVMRPATQEAAKEDALS
jgi:UDP-N-acetylglucosamine acyltransferase